MKDEPRAKQVVRWETYIPATAPHVRGRWTPESFDEDGIRLEQRVEAFCEPCGAPFKRTCTSGRTKELVNKFAQVHLACQALVVATEQVEATTSVRRRRLLRAVVESTEQTNEERRVIDDELRPLFRHGTLRFRALSKMDAPEMGGDVLTPQVCRELLATIVGQLAPLHGISRERLTWLAGRRLSLVTPEKKYIPVGDFLEGRW